MEFSFFFFLSVFVCAIVIFISTFLFYKPKKTQQHGASTVNVNPTNDQEKVLPLPPGTTGWPLIGETVAYISKLTKGVPQEFVTDRIKKNYSSKVFKTSLLGHTVAIFYGPDGNKFLFNNERKLVQVWFPGHVNQLLMKSLTDNNNEGMKILRKKIAPYVSGEGLHKFVGKMDSVMRDHLETTWNNCDEITVDVAVRKYILKLALSFFLGVDDPTKLEKLSPLMDDLQAGLNSLPLNLPGTTFNRAMKASKLIVKDLEGMAKQRKTDILEKMATSTQDVLSSLALATYENGEFLKEVDVALSIQALMMAGFTTLTSQLTFTMKYLAELPDVYNEVLKEQMEIVKSKEPGKLLNWEDMRKMRYSWYVACEVLRFSIAGGTFREAITDFTYAGCSIPKGWKLHWVANMTHKNPEYFPDPEKFDPSRYDGNGPIPYTFVPFGGGSRMCPGNEYAKMAILVFMHNIVTKFKWEMLIPNEKVINAPEPKCSHGLPIRLFPHKP